MSRLGDPPPANSARRSLLSRELGLRIVSSIVLVALVVWALTVGGWFFAAIWLAAAIVGACEWIAMSRGEPRLPLMLATGAALTALVVAHLTGAPPWAMPAIAVLGAGLLAGLARGNGARLRAIAGFAGAAAIALVPPALRDDPAIGIAGPAWMFATVWATDIAAYFTGRGFGGPKLMPRVSPNKTWSGAMGGLVAGTLAGTAIVLQADIVLVQALGGIAVLLVVLVSAVASVVSQAGDLLESALKRHYAVKDSGHLIPGHGGVMDRLDGFFAVALLVGLFLVA